MRKGIIIFLLSMMTAAAYALPMSVECVGAKQVKNGTDTLFIFKDEIHLKSTIGEVDWYSTETGVAVQTDAEEIYPDAGGYYIVKDGVEYNPFYVFTYSDTGALTLSIEPECGSTALTLSGDTKPFVYKRRNGQSGTYARACSLSYNVLTWNGEMWADSAVQTETTLKEGNYILPALYGATPISLCYDPEIRSFFNMDSACVSVELKEDEVKAVNLHLTSLATARENDPAGNNELNRPTEQDIITATTSADYSGALEVAFYSNPTPAALYYSWTIYKASDVIMTRNDRDIRSVFEEPGSYRVVCKVNNDFCVSDSMEMKVNISESYLRVPNVFTPDGNGQNDEFRVAYRSLREFHCWVYNRWGKLVYDWTDPSKGWDGTINGRPASEGAYFYVIRALGTDAPKNASYVGLKASYKKGKANADESLIGVYQLSGDINLLRRKK